MSKGVVVAGTRGRMVEAEAKKAADEKEAVEDVATLLPPDVPSAASAASAAFDISCKRRKASSRLADMRNFKQKFSQKSVGSVLEFESQSNFF